MIYPDERIGGGPCNECGGCNTYCADCADPLLEDLNAVADAARTARAVLQMIQDSHLPRSHNVRMALNALTVAFDKLDGREVEK